MGSIKRGQNLASLPMYALCCHHASNVHICSHRFSGFNSSGFRSNFQRRGLSPKCSPAPEPLGAAHGRPSARVEIQQLWPRGPLRLNAGPKGRCHPPTSQPLVKPTPSVGEIKPNEGTIYVNLSYIVCISVILCDYACIVLMFAISMSV